MLLTIVRNKSIRAAFVLLALVMFAMHPERAFDWVAAISANLAESAEELVPRLLENLFELAK